MDEVSSIQRNELEPSILRNPSNISTEVGLQEASLEAKGSGPPSAIIPQSGKRLPGSRVGVICVCCLVFAVLLINVSFLVWAVTTHHISGGIATLQQGSCQTSATLNTWIHLVINLLSTGMLGGSNYCT